MIFFVILLIFFFQKVLSWLYFQSTKQSDVDQARYPNCLQRLSADDTSRQRVLYLKEAILSSGAEMFAQVW